MLFNGERIGDGSPPEVDIAVDPLEGTRLTARGMPSALAVIALSERGTMFDPGPCVYMEKLAGGPEHRRPPQPRRAASGGDPQGRQAQGLRHGRRHRRRARPSPARGADRRHARGRRPRPADHRRRRLRSPLRRLGRGRGGPAVGHRRHPRGRDLRSRDQVPGRPDPGPAVAARRRRAPGRRSTPATTSTRCSTPTASSPARTSSSPRPGVTDGELLQGVRYTGGKASTESLVMRSRSGTVRTVRARHDQAKLREVTGGPLRLAADAPSPASRSCRSGSRRAPTHGREAATRASTSEAPPA